MPLADLPAFQKQLLAARNRMKDSQIRGWIDDLTVKEDFRWACGQGEPQIACARTLAKASAMRFWPDCADVPTYVLGHLVNLGVEVKW